MAATPTPDINHPRDLAQRSVPQAAPQSLLTAHLTAPASAMTGAGDGLMSARAPRPRRCMLCGGALRAGQHMLRIHGSTVHARCTNTER
jgi:hypothetical protein